MPSHTPAPWWIEEDHIAGIIQYDIASEEHGDLAVVFEKTDARLIAVAPELYEALQDLVACAEVYDEFNDPNHDYYMAMHKAFMALHRVEVEAG